jgi:hypothetical protein
MKNRNETTFTACKAEVYSSGNSRVRAIQKFKTFCMLSFLFLNPSNVQAQPEANYAIHANIIYRFTKYIDWPATKKSGNFIIGIIGDSPLYDELISFTDNKTVGNQKIVVKKFSSSASTYNCHILFISEDESSSLKKIAAHTENSPVLLVSESPGLARKGACINFAIVDDRLKLEINKNSIEQRNMRIASELLQLGILVK